MQRLIWIAGLWLVGTLPALAVDLKAAEVLNYRVYWGILRVGSAQISYAPAGNAYVLRAVVKDSSSLIELHDTWETQGMHTDKKPFVPRIYHAVQAENKYRADKTMTFDGKNGKIIYRNNRNPPDGVPDLTWNGERDALSTVFAWRMGGTDEVKKAAQTEIINMKEKVMLRRDAGERAVLKLGNKEHDVWRVKLRTVEGGKPGSESWTVYLKNDAKLTPVQIIAATKFGTFRATLQ